MFKTGNMIFIAPPDLSTSKSKLAINILKRLTLTLWLTSSIPIQAETLNLVSSFWEPYSGPDLTNKGLAVDIVQTVLHKADHKTTITFEPWARALRNTYSGKYDGIVAIWSNKERVKNISLSNSYYKNRLIFLKHRSTNIKYKESKDLEGLLIGTIRDYDYSPEFIAADHFRKVPENRLKQNFIKLLYKRIDLAIFDELIALHYLNKNAYNFIKDLEIIYPALSETPLYFGMSKRHPHHERVLKSFNKALSKAKKDGTYKEIFVRHGFR
jgi:polar amino acid transport system substrate-binding protein